MIGFLARNESVFDGIFDLRQACGCAGLDLRRFHDQIFHDVPRRHSRQGEGEPDEQEVDVWGVSPSHRIRP